MAPRNELETQLATDFLQRWPTLQSVQREKVQTIRKFYYGHNCRRADLIEQRIEEIRAAQAKLADPRGVDPAEGAGVPSVTALPCAE